MSMFKILEYNSQHLGDAILTQIKIGERGRLIGNDRLTFEKRAGARFVHELDKIEAAPGEELIHLLAVGATEFYGPNRNGDGFKAAACRRSHPTFVKHAKFYRDHLSRDPSKSYGIVKLSDYNEAMHRIELVCALNATKEAALRNGGLIADRELEKLARKQDIPVSMGCGVPFDVCSYCQNKAPTRKEYCDDVANGGHCKAGGLKHNMGRTVEVDGDLHQLHADNTFPKFGDISHVFRGADRIAYVSGLLKAAAAAGRVVSGAELAEAFGMHAHYNPIAFSDVHLLPSQVEAQIKLAYELADKENSGNTFCLNQVVAFSPDVRDPLVIPAGHREKFGQVMRALADHRCLLTLPEFLQLTTDCTLKQARDNGAAAQMFLPGIYGNLIADPYFADLVRANPYTPAPAATDALQLWAVKQAATLSLDEPHVTRRLRLAAIRNISPDVVETTELRKLAGNSGPAYELAKHYALYKLAFLSQISTQVKDLPLTARLVLLQNHAS